MRGPALAAVLAVALSAATARAQAPADSARASALGDTMRAPAPADTTRIPALGDTMRAPAPADTPAPADSALRRFLGALSDSTDLYFGGTTAPVDTAGFDSVLAFRLANPHQKQRPRGALEREYGPWFRFNRVDGPMYGGTFAIGRPLAWGMALTRVGYAAGPNDWLGAVDYRKNWGRLRDPSTWRLRSIAGLLTQTMDRESSEPVLGSLRALIAGRDAQNYLRQEGWRVMFERETASWRLGVGWRDEIERPMETTATWNLTGSTPIVIDNLQAMPGRNRELTVEGTMRIPGVAGWIAAKGARSAHNFDSDFQYWRGHVGLGAEVPLGRAGSLIPQGSYGRLHGDVMPQASFYLGGSRSLRSLPSSSIGGTGEVLGRLDFVGAPDLLALAHVPHPAAFPLQGSVFAAAGAVWGTDPFGGPHVYGVDWPGRDAWFYEAGAALLYRPGLPDPMGYFSISFAMPIDDADRGSRIGLYYSRALTAVRPIDR